MDCPLWWGWIEFQSDFHPREVSSSVKLFDRISNDCFAGVDLDQRRSAEEETVASIVEEVLASSPELVGDGAAALPPGQ